MSTADKLIALPLEGIVETENPGLGYVDRVLISEETLRALVAVVAAAEDVSIIEATGVLPDFQPLADSLAALDHALGGGE